MLTMAYTHWSAQPSFMFYVQQSLEGCLGHFEVKKVNLPFKAQLKSAKGALQMHQT